MDESFFSRYGGWRARTNAAAAATATPTPRQSKNPVRAMRSRHSVYPPCARRAFQSPRGPRIDRSAPELRRRVRAARPTFFIAAERGPPP